MDIKLTKDGDLDVSTGDIRLTDSLAQQVAIRLRWILGEWRFGPENGMPYFETLLVKNPDLAAIKRVIRTEILAVENISSVRDLTVNFHPVKRELRCSFNAATNTGNERMEVAISA